MDPPPSSNHKPDRANPPSPRDCSVSVHLLHPLYSERMWQNHSFCCRLVSDLLMDAARDEMSLNNHLHKNILVAMNLVFRLVTMRSPPAFVTTFLLEQDALARSLMQ